MDLLILAISWAYVFLAPYSKVEESFNLHATHDVLMYSVRPELLTKVCYLTSPVFLVTDIACSMTTKPSLAPYRAHLSPASSWGG